MNHCWKKLGLLATLIALLSLHGAHWMALQSVAWARMVVVFSRHDSFGAAVGKTFDGRHPCAMCRAIRTGAQQEQQQQGKAPLLKTEQLPELFCDSAGVPVPLAPTAAMDCPPFPPAGYAGIIDPPPTPPPRTAQAMLWL